MPRRKKKPAHHSNDSGNRSDSDRVTEYARDVVDGRITTGKLVRLACERHLRDLVEGPSRGLAWNAAEAHRVIAIFAECRQSKGRWSGEPLVLQPWQAFMVGSIFGWKIAATGLRRFRTAYTEVARKNGKSTIAAGIGLILADFDGEPGAEVYAAATIREQAKIVWTEAERMVKRSPEIRARLKIVPSTATMYCEATASKFAALGADANSLDGLNVHGAIVDELHAHRTREVVDVLETASGARQQPLFFYITTAGILGDQTIYAEQHGYARRVVEGVVDDDQWFVFIAALDDDDEWTDSSKYVKANPSLGVTVELAELVAERDRAMQAPGRQNAFRRLRLNQRTQQVDRWIDLAAWDACPSRIDPAALGGRICFGGLDLATTTDLSVLVLVFPVDSEYQVLPFFWVPADTVERRVRDDRVPYDVWIRAGLIETTEGNVTDYDLIRRRVNEIGEQYQVREIAYDSWNATQLAVQLEGDGFTMAQFRQGFASMTEPTKHLERLILARELNHGGHPVLRWMANNVSVRQDPAGNLKPDKAKSTERIDGIVALVMGLGRAIVAAPDGSVYEERGVLSL